MIHKHVCCILFLQEKCDNHAQLSHRVKLSHGRASPNDITPWVNPAHHMLATPLKINTLFFLKKKKRQIVFSKIIFMENKFCLFFQENYIFAEFLDFFYDITSFICFSPLPLPWPLLKVKLIQGNLRLWVNSICPGKSKPQGTLRKENAAHSPVLPSQRMCKRCEASIGSGLRPSCFKHFVPAHFLLIPVSKGG